MRIGQRLMQGIFAALCITWMAQAPATEYSASFKGTDIEEFINIVGKNLNKTIIIDPGVRGKVNVRSYDLLSEAQYYQFFLNVLEVYGYAVVEMDNGIVKVIKNKDAKTAAIPVVGDRNPGKGDEFVTRVVQVKNVSVRELAPLLRQLNDNAGGGNVVHYDPSNVIMLTGRAAVVNRLVEIIRLVDKAGDQEVEIVKLNFASAAEMVRITDNLLRTTGGKDATPGFLKPKVVADERTNSVLVSGEPKARDRIVQLIRRLDNELETDGNTKVFYLKYAQAPDMVSVLKGVSDTIAQEAAGGGKGKKASTQRNISIEAHEDSNALVITAQPDMMRTLEGVIRSLDIRRAQVLVEAIIVEVQDGDGINLGVQWFSEDAGLMQWNNGTQAPVSALWAAQREAQPEGGETITTIDGNGNPVTTTNPETDGDISLLAQVLGNINGIMVGSINDDWAAVIQAVSTTTNSNILATPSITTLDNQEAYFIVGQDVPVLTGSTSSSSNDNPFQTIERQEVGVKLKVTPQINEGNAVQLVIEQEVSSISGTTDVDITINKRELKTTVMADDGGTIVLGGLIDEDAQESVSKVPLLGDIPWIGELFRSTNTTKRKRNLLVFIRPTIVRDDMTMNEISNRKYNFIRAQQLRKNEEGLRHLDTSVPLLPEWKSADLPPPSFEDYMRERIEAEAEARRRAEED
ncbi:type II secretion system secretin GspD [Corallincola platygyrae]|uniref:Type II secretion system secretin GspD n=1 Tax=Corallincola platygyrae TaxID=1193278 RepID=A0ABW4XPG6_9GAMM